MAKKRIDSLLVERNLAEDIARARAILMAGEVSVGGSLVTKAGALVPEDAEIVLTGQSPYVGRGGLKLEHALDEFGIDVTGKVAADIGASTGGFTDCLLQRGVSRVYAIDVGYGQLDYRLRRDERVVVMERVNARYPLELPEKVGLAVIDVSFISLEKIIPPVADILEDDVLIVALLKPQFEARKNEVGKGGVIRKAEVHARVLARFITWAVGQGYRLKGLTASPITGASGNREFFLLIGLT